MLLIAENLESVPKKSANQTLVDYAECLTDWYIDKIPIEIRKKKGQYFTPQEVSKLMVHLFDDINQKKDVKILDPGAGIGIFESTFCENIKLFDCKNKITFELYENDVSVIPLLELNMKTCKECMANEGYDISYKIIKEDFILSNAPIFNNLEKFDANKDGYDFVISNPPYYKLNKNSPQVIALKNIISVQPNIYSLFMVISAKLLKNGGQMTFLTPRSYCSGLYFGKFRKWFFKIIKPQKIHLFESRREVFKKYEVLQENIILNAIKSSEIPEKVRISISNGIPYPNKIIRRETTFDKIIVQNDNDIFLRIPISEMDELIAIFIDKLDEKLENMGFNVSTGPVVPFRTKNFLLKSTYNRDDFVPLIWMHNIINGEVKWPLKRKNVPVGLRKTRKSMKILNQNKNYVLIKRFSTKEGKQRINAGIYIGNSINSEYLGIENHVNYIYKKDGELTIDEAFGITALLNSKLYNKYFQITNGSTQVNAIEIRNLPFPSLEKIRDIGNLIQKLDQTDNISKESIIINSLKIDNNISKELLQINI